jgi:hypothetical protein
METVEEGAGKIDTLTSISSRLRIGFERLHSF